MTETSPYNLVHGDALDILRSYPDDYVDSMVTDPPGSISMHGREWDTFESRERFIAVLECIFSEARRVVKKNGCALVWSHPQTSHWTATALENAGWPIQNRIVHLHGNGYHKGKSLPDGWSTGLRPGSEEWILCGTGPLNIAKCANESGRVPTNVVLSHADDCDASACAVTCPVAELDRQSGFSRSRKGKPRKSASAGQGYGMTHTGVEYSDAGGASRFFPVFKYAKRASTKEKDLGCESLFWKKNKQSESGFERVSRDIWATLPENNRAQGNIHETVKSLDLMGWLCNLITPTGGIVLDPFSGSGSTIIAAVDNGFRAIGIDTVDDYNHIAHQRLASSRSPAMPMP